MTVVARRLPERSTTSAGDRDRRLGRHIEHDPRSRAFAVPAGRGKLKPVLWPRLGGPFDQGNVGSCTGNAMAGLLNTAPFHRAHARYLKEQDALRIYSKATALDTWDGTYPPDDTGSSGLAVAKAAKGEGRIRGYRHAFGIEQALRALQHGPVITGVTWYETFDIPGADSALVAIGGQERGGHEFEVVGYDPVTDIVSAWNSWGPNWGKGGMFFFTSATWATLLEQQGDVTVPLPLL